LQTDEESKRSELSPSAPLESSHAPEQAFERCSDGEAGDDIARHQDGPDGREICTTANQANIPNRPSRAERLRFSDGWLLPSEQRSFDPCCGGTPVKSLAILVLNNLRSRPQP